MRFFLAALLIISFAGVAVFGFFAMDHADGHGYSGCIAATSRGVDCPREADPLGVAAFHLVAFKSFSTATFASVMAGMLLLVLAFAYTSHALLDVRKQASPARARFFRFLDGRSYLLGEQIRYWLALHENSPGVI